MTHKTYAEAKATLPKEAKISSTFGYPADDNYSEAWRVDGWTRVYWINKQDDGSYRVEIH